MFAVTYPGDTTFAFRFGVTCVVRRDGALLLDPPHRVQLTDLTKIEVQALERLSHGPATISEISSNEQPAEAGEIAALIDDLATTGWLAVAVRHEGQQCYSILPFGEPPEWPVGPELRSLAMSKFAIVHRDSDGFVIEHPLTWCDVRVHDCRLLTLLDGTAAVCSGLPAAVTSRFIEDLRWSGILVPVGQEEAQFETLSWSAPDLWFHRRSTLGERTITWEHFGPTKWAKGRFRQPPARRKSYPGEPFRLPVPDLAAKRLRDPTLTAVLEDRVSTRSFDEAHPITADQVGELLYRAARTRRTQPSGDAEQLLSRPYPSAGSVYELELYPVIRNVAGLSPGMYHYDSFDHSLRLVASADSTAVSQLIAPAAATLAGGAEPQALIVMAARCGRIMWTYEQLAYATILKDVGVLMQTIYLAATAMGIGACAQGYGDTSAFVAATGVDELQECSVGSMVIGSPARS
ncbi:SagB family peptide dehydrogenase [Mycobacterium kubicae]|uniref:SagB family peptide dehydrogenase n=1 Tax=Mycobacterium kubicae TaxID=120959 RepID=A0AAX1J766_9MYCO|nr:SagB family peptide dehydrogenase [Mycobacterium kubicae]MCV7095148.1 SagB family peptide dehydrogenase [Mycobacterium kubicae]ORW05660.1 dehydrogenase [Mycobacterium kubicae]QNI12764.1 SagB/ThcOx family dehydrogenase [Mycobacterium kubicae]QPI36278.1 SagB family peptide dehydrogenase [Mycobacterium kubicae]